MGMTIAEPTVQQFSLRFEDFKDTLVKCKEKDVQLLFVVLPAGEREYYHKVSDCFLFYFILFGASTTIRLIY